jgi:hypothetical protein
MAVRIKLGDFQSVSGDCLGRSYIGCFPRMSGLTRHGDRFALEGHPLAAGHPLHDAYIGRPDPLANQSQNSVTYGSLPEEGPLLIRPCACGCGQETARDFAQGHDVKAVQQRVREHFGGSVLALVRWIDSAHPRPAS